MLADKTVIVAGAGNGLGRHAAEHLAARGANVVVNDLGTSVHGEGSDPAVAEAVAEAIQDAGDEAVSHHGDVADPADAADLIETAVEAYDRVDGIANFAGVLRDGWISNLTDVDWAEALRANLGGNFALCRAAVRHWRGYEARLEQQRSYLGVSSMGALGNPGQLNYSASKAGVLGFVRSASTELYDQNIRVNALVPSGFTRMTETVPEAHRPYTREEMPPERVAPMVAYLVADAAEDVTGCTLFAGGDRIGLFSEPRLERSAYQEGGWTAEGIAHQMDGDLAEDVELTRTERFL
jgi:NAD(P)-dependent dehydrogenase (short-subunit alcohol dehydrogenase family)